MILLSNFDIAQGNHWQSMHYFLELGIVSTDFFTEPINKNIYNDQVCMLLLWLKAGLDSCS